jgi:hypothetical protein
MDKHTTDIELFELANDLIADQIQIDRIENHIAICDSCAIRFEKEKTMDSLLATNLSISETVDISKNIELHFKEKPIINLLDTNWIVYTILSLLGVLALVLLKDYNLIDSVKGFEIPQMQYVKVIIFAVVGILLLDLFSKYLKQKKQLVIS